MKKLLLALLLAPLVVSAQVKVSQLPVAGTLTGTEAVPVVQGGTTVQTTTAKIGNFTGTNGVNAATFPGFLCDGVHDTWPALSAALATVPSGGSLYIPPQASNCMMSTDIAPAVPMKIWAQRGTVTLQPTAGNVANPVLLNVVNVNSVIVEGLIFDGGGTANSNASNIVTAFNTSHSEFQYNVFQNTRGIAVLLSNVAFTGVDDNDFSNIGMFWQTSGLAADRHQAIAYCCTGTLTPVKNHANHNHFYNGIGLDAISATGQIDFLAEGNEFALSTAQDAQAFGNWPACVYGDTNTSITIADNVCQSPPGNGIDMGKASSPTTGLVVKGNYVTGAGGAGIALSGVSNFTIGTNLLTNNGANTSACGRDGIALLDAIGPGVISGTVATDTRAGGSKTQQNGIEAFTGCGHVATLTGVSIESSNYFFGNAVQNYTGNVTGVGGLQFIVSTLPTCNTATTGLTYIVTDANGPTYGATLVGSGAIKTPAFCNGSNWTAH